ncbi:MAG: Gfo/Idh/MocA family protein [Phycisphaerales bacterium]
MGFLKHVPGTVPVVTPARHPKAKGVGVLGLHEGRTLLVALSTRTSRAYPVAGCDLSEEKLAASRAELPGLFYTTDYDAMLARPDVEIVAIYTPDALHGQHVCRAFEAGKDVICTKPLVNSVADARRVLETGRRTGRRLLVGQSTRFFEPFRRQRAAFERGEIGRVELADAHYIHRMDWYYAKSPWAAKDTDWVFLGLSHPIDLLRWYLGPIRRVQATGGASALGRGHQLSGRDIYAVNVEAADGVLGRAMGHYGVHELPTARNCIELMLYGSEGSSLAQYHDMRYVHTGGRDEETERRRDEGGAVGFKPSALAEITEDCLYAGREFYFNNEVHGMHYGEFAHYAEAFAAALIDGVPTSPELEEGIDTFCVMESVRRASASGQPVEVDEVRREVGL